MGVRCRFGVGGVFVILASWCVAIGAPGQPATPMRRVAAAAEMNSTAAIRSGMPELVGMNRGEAIAVLAARRLSPHTILSAPSPKPAGTVVGQFPLPGARINAEIPITLYLAAAVRPPPRTPAPATMPDVRRLPLQGAVVRLWMERLKPSAVRTLAAPAAEPGAVFAQEPSPGAAVAGDTPISLYVAAARPQILMPDLIAMSRDGAANLLASRHLGPAAITTTAASAPAGTVIGQSPLAGAVVREATAINLKVSVGPPAPARMPGLIKLSRARAEAVLAGLNLRPAAVATSASPVLAGTVIAQAPLAGALVNAQTSISLTVSNGPAPLPPQPTMPDLIGKRRDDAATTLAKNNLGPAAVAVTASDAPARLVIGQQPPAGAVVNPGAPIDLTVSGGPAPPPAPLMPDLIGMTRDRAAGALASAHLEQGQVTGAASAKPAGTIIGQTPPPGAPVTPATQIALFAAVPSVPNLDGLPLAGAHEAITAGGYGVGPTSWSFADAPIGRVFRQRPRAGQIVAAGSPVVVTASLGPWWGPVAGAAGLGALAAACALALMAAISVRPGWDETVETEARIEEAHAAPDVSLDAWLEPGEAAVVGPLPILTPSPTDPGVANG